MGSRRVSSIALCLVVALLIPACASSGRDNPRREAGAQADTASAAPPASSAEDFPQTGLYSQGQELWLVVAAAAPTRADAEARLRKLQGLLGEDASALMVDASSHYDGLEPGAWLVLTAADTEDRARAAKGSYAKGDLIPYVKRARKLCDHPLIVQCTS